MILELKLNWKAEWELQTFNFYKIHDIHRIREEWSNDVFVAALKKSNGNRGNAYDKIIRCISSR